VNPKDIVGETKPGVHLVPPPALVRLAKVMELGAKKYGPYNWRDHAVQYHVYVSAALRHLLSAFDGEDIDPESGQSHLAHAMACCAILIDAGETGNLIDDRPKAGVAGKLIADLTGKKEMTTTQAMATRAKEKLLAAAPLPHPPMQKYVCDREGCHKPCEGHHGQHCIFCNIELKESV